MSVFHILAWVLFGMCAGLLGKLVFPGNSGVSGWHTVVLGVVGSFTGGGINYLLGWGHDIFAPSGLLMSIVGVVICLYLYKWWRTNE